MRKWDSAGLVTYLVQASSCPQHRAFRNLIHSRELDGHASNPFETTSLKCKTLAVAKPMPSYHMWRWQLCFRARSTCFTSTQSFTEHRQVRRWARHGFDFTHRGIADLSKRVQFPRIFWFSGNELWVAHGWGQSTALALSVASSWGSLQKPSKIVR